MSIIQRGALWHYRFNYRGKIFAGSTGLSVTDLKKPPVEAKAFEAQKRVEAKASFERIADEQALPASNPTFTVALDHFLDACSVRKSPGFYKRIKISSACLRAYFGVNLNDIRMRDIKKAHVENFITHRLESRKAKANTVRGDLMVLSMLFQHGMTHEWCAENLVGDRNGKNGVAMPKIPAGEDIRINPYSREQEAKYFAEAIKLTDHLGLHNLHDVAKIMVNCGCRPSEVVSLAKTQLDVAKGEVRILKGKSRSARRTVILTQEALGILKARLQTPGPWLFPSDKNHQKHVQANTMANAQIGVARACGLTQCLYDFRHTFATRHLVEHHTDVATMKDLLGHSNLRCILNYCHSNPTAQRSAMAEFEAAEMRARIAVVRSEVA